MTWPGAGSGSGADAKAQGLVDGLGRFWDGGGQTAVLAWGAVPADGMSFRASIPAPKAFCPGWGCGRAAWMPAWGPWDGSNRFNLNLPALQAVA